MMIDMVGMHNVVPVLPVDVVHGEGDVYIGVVVGGGVGVVVMILCHPNCHRHHHHHPSPVIYRLDRGCCRRCYQG